VGSGLEHNEITSLFKVDHCPGTGFQVDRRVKPLNCSGSRRGTCKGQILAQINPWHIVDFSSEIFLAQYCICNFYNLGKIGYALFDSALSVNKAVTSTNMSNSDKCI